MPFELKVFGEFKLQVSLDGNVRTIESVDVRAFTCLASVNRLIENSGCYVFCMKHGSKITPWYVGKATGSFKQECFTPHKIMKYNKALALRPNATPYMYFVSQIDGRSIPERIISEIEKFLIKKACNKNKKLLNTHHTGESEWRITGAIGARPGESSQASTSFKAALGLSGK